MIDANVLHSRIEAVAPIRGIVIGDESDKTTWIIRFADTATDEQKAAAQVIMDGFDPDAPENAPPEPMNIEDEITALKKALIKKGALTDTELKAERRGPR